VKTAAKIVSYAALAGTILPPVLFFYDQMGLEPMKAWMLASAAAWFASAPLWMNK
jgi:TM2 domain-containing membrane protein YozV